MNKLEHYIVEIYSIIDVTDNLKRYNAWRKASTPIYEVYMLVNCCGILSEVTEIFSNNQWEEVKRNGYYMG